MERKWNPDEMSYDAYRMRGAPVLGKALQFYDDLRQPWGNPLEAEGMPVLSDMSRAELMEGLGNYLPVMDSSGLAGIYRKATAAKYKKAFEEATGDMPLGQRVLVDLKPPKELASINRKKGGGAYIGYGQDDGGMFTLTPKGDYVELGSVAVSPDKQGKGVGKRIAKEAVKLNSLDGNKPLRVSAFNEIEETGIDNSKYWRERGFDKEVARHKFKQEHAPEGYDYSPSDVSELEYTGGLLGSADSPVIHPEKWKPWNSKLFDVEGMDRFDRYPKAVQMEIARKMPAVSTPRVQALLADKGTKQRLMDFYRKGVPKGGEAWYNTRPLLDRSIEFSGDAVGREHWRDTMGVSSAVSPNTRVQKEIARQSFLRNFQNVHGRFPERGMGEVPEGYGAVSLHSSMIPMARDFQSGVGIGQNLGKADKVKSYVQSKMGNLANLTGDVHNEKILMSPYTRIKTRQGNPSKLMGGYSDTEYGAIENLHRELASDASTHPAMMQAGIWTGGSDITNVHDFRPWLQIYEEKILDTARQTGLDPEDVLKGVLSGDSYLLK